jgi:hypothetical protein
MSTQNTTKQINELKEIRNNNFKWVYFLGNPHVWDIQQDTWIVSVNDNRLYFNGELSFYGTSELFENREEAMIISTQIVNSHF